MDTVKTKKGTELPLMNLKGKRYLQVAHRILWFSEDFPVGRASIQTEFLLLTDEQTVCKAKIYTMDEQGRVALVAEATKRETKKDFADHTEKAETGAIGRALSLIGYGTQFAVELDEGSRIVDAPQPAVRPAVAAVESPAVAVTTQLKTGSFGRKVGAPAQAGGDDWS